MFNLKPFVILLFLCFIGMLMRTRGVKSFYCLLPATMMLAIMVLLMLTRH